MQLRREFLVMVVTGFLGLYLATCCATLAQGFDEAAVLDTSITTFSCYGKTLRVWEAVGNTALPGNPERWNFRYEPAFARKMALQARHDELAAVVTANPRGSAKRLLAEAELSSPLALTFHPLPNEYIQQIPLSRTRIFIPVLLGGRECQEAALAALKNALPRDAAKLSQANVSLVPISRIVVTSPDLQGLVSRAKIVNGTYGFTATPESLEIQVDVKGDDSLRETVRLLDAVQFSLGIDYSIKTAAQNIASIDWDKLVNTRLHDKLNGLGTTEVYVKRDALRKLSLGASEQLRATMIVASPEYVNFNLADELIRKFGEDMKVEYANFTEQMWAATYDADDLKPQKIEHFLNTALEKSSDKWHLKTDVSGSGGGEASILGGLVSVGGNASGNYSSDELKEAAREKGFTIDYSGDKWVAKAVDLVRLNMADLKAKKSAILETRVLKPGSELRGIQNSVTLH